MQLRKPGRQPLLENSSSKAVRTQLTILKCSLRRELFSGENEATDRQRKKFIEITGEEMLCDSAVLGRQNPSPEYMNHLIWTANNFPCQETRVKALTHLILLARDMNYGQHPPEKNLRSVSDEIMGIKNILYNSLGMDYSYMSKSFIHEPKRMPDFQRFALGIAKWVKRAGIVLMPVYLAVAHSEGSLGIVKTLAVAGLSATIYGAGVALNRISRRFLSESRLMESFIRRAVSEREWNKKVRA